MYVGLSKIGSWEAGQFISTAPRKIKFLQQNLMFTFVKNLVEVQLIVLEMKHADGQARISCTASISCIAWENEHRFREFPL